MRESSIAAASWPTERVGEALHALARATGLATTCRDALVAPAGLTPDDLHAWIDAAAELGGLRATQAMASLDEMAALLEGAAPLLLRLDTSEGSRFLAVTGSRGQTLHVLGPDLRGHRLQFTAVCDLIRKPFEPAATADLDRVLDRVGLSTRRRARARAAMMAERLQSVRLRSCWLVRLPPGCPVAHEIQETRFTAGLTWLFALHLAQYGVFVASWWLLGRGLLTGTIDTGWLAGWLLLVLTLVPLRVAASWRQGVISTTAGSAIRRRLLRGALRIDRESIKTQGSGQLFGVVAEAEAVESLALNGGITSLFALAELVVAAAVVYAGAGIVPLTLLLVCVAAAVLLSWRFVAERRKWTAERLHLTDRLLESMTGHRTRLAQQPAERWHPEEDATLARYLESGQAMDRSGIRLQLMPRVWLTLAIAAMTMALVSHASAGSLIASIGGILLAYRSLKRLATGLSSLSGAVIAGQAIRPLAEAAAIARATAHPNAVVPSTVAMEAAAADAVPAVQARTLAFRYPHQAEPVLDDCTLTIAKGARVLLEGASGSGKTTLAAIVAGLEQPDSGLLLIDGLDRSILGDAGWRRRVVMAPEAHDNYLITGSLAFNLLLGRRWPAQRAELIEAEEVCRELGLGDLLDRMPGGLHQVVGETGWQLSQGERARVFLARALLHKPEVLVLDESFSALDPENLDRTIRCVQRRAATVLAVAHA